MTSYVACSCNSNIRGKTREDIKGVSGNGIGELGDDSKTVPSIRDLIGGCINGWGGVRKSRGRVRM
jgi:hypothetical protein